MSGYNFNSRCGSSILKNSNLDNLIALDKKDYINKVLILTDNFDNLNKLRRKIFDEILTKPLFDGYSFAEDFYDHILKVYKNLY